MVGRVARAVEGAEGCPSCLECLAVINRVLTSAGVVLMDCRFGAERQEVLYAADMVGVPVGYERLRDSSMFGGEDGREEARPRGFAFARVDQETFWPSADQVGVCA